ncbi:uncharacterized protein [Typha latifolia]|uniref:uncharacterized protein isoform X1 n=1 Tax=Typha latifolia TaxID=4733 RepID=UPI003C304F22
MATIEETMDNSEINHGAPESFPDDPISSDVAAAKESNVVSYQEAEAGTETETEIEIEAGEGGEAKTKAEAEKSVIGGTITSILMISGVVVAAIGVAFFVTKKLKET